MRMRFSKWAKCFLMEYSTLPEFERDLKKLLKKFKTLEEDLVVLKKFLNSTSHPSPPLTVHISNLGIEHPLIIKVKSFACRALKGKGRRSGIRVVYAYFIKEQRIEFIEMYYKGTKDLEDRGRILKLYSP